jgi:hypothetical protein
MRKIVVLLASTAALAAPAAAVGAPFKVSLKTPKGQPKANKLWKITVGAHSNSGKKLHASAYYQFLFNGQVVSTQYPDPKHPGTVGGRDSAWKFAGSYTDHLLFPDRSAGIPLTLRVQVTVKGKGTLHKDRKIRVSP